MTTEFPGPLLIHPLVLTTIREAAAKAFPEECCGALLGMDQVAGTGPGETAQRIVCRAIELENQEPVRRDSHFLIRADTVQGVEALAQGMGLELVGFFHSHPDGEPAPSEFDLEAAWPWYSYLILGLRGTDIRTGPNDGTVTEPGWSEFGVVRGWRLDHDRTTFVEQNLLIVGEGREDPCRSP